MRIQDLSKIKEIYEKGGGNIVKWIKDQEQRVETHVDDILISYDFQAGTYYDLYVNKATDFDYSLGHSKIAANIQRYLNLITNDRLTSISKNGISMMECGVGEATTLSGILNNMDISGISLIYGFDISWSRIKYADKCLKVMNTKEAYNKIQLFTADMFHIPLKDNSIDLVYTNHSAEPNGGKEREILEELYRVSKKYLILIEPAYELAEDEARKRMKEQGYVTCLYDTAIELGYNILSYELLNADINQLNPAGVMVIKKEEVEENEAKLCCPITKHYLEIQNDVMYCKESYLAYPILKGVPCLIEDNAILATKWENFEEM